MTSPKDDAEAREIAKALTPEQVADLRQLDLHFEDGEDAPREMLDRNTKLGFLVRLRPRYWEFTDKGAAVAAVLKEKT